MVEGSAHHYHHRRSQLSASPSPITAPPFALHSHIELNRNRISILNLNIPNSPLQQWSSLLQLQQAMGQLEQNNRRPPPPAATAEAATIASPTRHYFSWPCSHCNSEFNQSLPNNSHPRTLSRVRLFSCKRL